MNNVKEVRKLTYGAIALFVIAALIIILMEANSLGNDGILFGMIVGAFGFVYVIGALCAAFCDDAEAIMPPKMFTKEADTTVIDWPSRWRVLRGAIQYVLTGKGLHLSGGVQFAVGNKPVGITAETWIGVKKAGEPLVWEHWSVTFDGTKAVGCVNGTAVPL